MASKTTALRPVIILESSAGTGFRYTTRTNRRNTPDRMRLKKYDPIARAHVEFVETR